MTAPPVSSSATKPTSGRRRRRLRRKLATAGVAVSLLSVVLLGAFNFFEARALLTEGVESQLASQGAARAQTLRDGLASIKDEVSVIAAGGRVGEALSTFADAYDRLDQADRLLDDTQLAELEVFYEDAVAAAEAAGAAVPPAEALIPQNAAGRYLQYHYIVDNPFPPGERADLVAAEGDDSVYATAHAELHPGLANLVSTLGYGDLFLVDTSGRVVYSVNKRPDFGTILTPGADDTPGIVDTVSRRLAAAATGETVFTDFELYLPAGGSPTMFAAAAVRSNTETVGAVVVEVPIEALNELTTAGGRWEETGLATTGEVYIVGSDGLMRSESRLWLEDPQAYIRQATDAGLSAGILETIETQGSVVLHQPVDTQAVDAALGGETFIGRSDNYLGRHSLSYATPAGLEEVDWVVVAEVASQEADDPLQLFLRRLLITAGLLLPLAAILSVALADRMTKPVAPVVEAAAAIASGALDTRLPDMGHNEFGDVAHQMNLFAAYIDNQEQNLSEQEDEVSRLLLSALPPRLVDRVRQGERNIDDLVDTATVIAITLEGLHEQAGIDPESAVEIGSRLSRELEGLAETHGVERVRSSSDHHLFVAGLDGPETDADRAAAFVLDAARIGKELGEEVGADIAFHAGLASGSVISGLLSGSHLTYGVFGVPAQVAMSLDAVAKVFQILTDNSTADDLSPQWQLEPARGLTDLRGDPVTAQLLLGRTLDAPGPETGSESAV